jgi:CarD family transcriptional regulator
MSKSSKKTPDTTFKEGQQVVYPLQGVGQVQSIESIDFRKDGNPILYYIIYLPVSDMTVKVPVDKAEELGIRAIVPKKEAEKALNLFTEEYEPVPADWKMRYQMNLDLLKQGSVIDIATVVRTLYHRKKVKELPILERKLYDSALKLLIDEVSFSLNVSKPEVEEMIFSKLEVESEREEEEEEEESFEEEDDIDVDLDEDEEE